MVFLVLANPFPRSAFRFYGWLNNKLGYFVTQPEDGIRWELFFALNIDELSTILFGMRKTY